MWQQSVVGIIIYGNSTCVDKKLVQANTWQKYHRQTTCLSIHISVNINRFLFLKLKLTTKQVVIIHFECNEYV